MDRQGVLARNIALLVDRIAENVEDAPEGDFADRYRDRAAGVEHGNAAGEAVGRRHRDRADPVVAEVLLDLAGERLQAFALDLDGVVDARQLARRELDVHDRSGDLDDSARRGGCGARHGDVASCSRQPALAPDAISIISRVMFDWRTLL